MNRFEILMMVAKHYLGTPYIWGGDDPSGFDCSGFVLECLKSVGEVGEHEDFTADQLMKKYAANELSAPTGGCLVFYLRPDGTARHVVIALSPLYHIGADSGGSGDTTPAQAWKDNAYVKVRPTKFDPATMKAVNPFS